MSEMLTASEIAAVTKGRISGLSGSESTHGQLFFDSRKPITGGIFLALKGEHVDGHDFASRSGGVLSIVSREVEGPCIIVDDVLNAAAQLAQYKRRKLPNLKVIGITGSQGKTTTKDMIAHLLNSTSAREKGSVISPIGSYNNDLGLPVTLSMCDESTAFCVAEMGARHKGDIARLASIAEPEIGLVLKVGTAHIGEFGSREEIAATKAELVGGIAQSGTAILGTYDEFTPLMARNRLDLKVITFGEGGSETIRATDVEIRSGFAHFELVTPNGREVIELSVPGAHNIANALATAAVGFVLEIPLNEIATALSTFTSMSKWRMEMSEIGGITIINDSYNANPESMEAALKTTALLAQERGGRSFAFLGTMHELGESSDEMHRNIGRIAGNLGIDYLIAVAEPRFLDPSHPEWIAASSFREASNLFAHIESGDCVLFKASRAEGLERLAADFKAFAAGQADLGEKGST